MCFLIYLVLLAYQVHLMAETRMTMSPFYLLTMVFYVAYLVYVVYDDGVVYLVYVVYDDLMAFLVCLDDLVLLADVV